MMLTDKAALPTSPWALQVIVLTYRGYHTHFIFRKRSFEPSLNTEILELHIFVQPCDENTLLLMDSVARFQLPTSAEGSVVGPLLPMQKTFLCLPAASSSPSHPWHCGQLWPGLVLQAAVAWPRLALRAALARHGVALWAVEAKPISVLSSCLLIRREERSSVLRWGLSYKCS